MSVVLVEWLHSFSRNKKEFDFQCLSWKVGVNLSRSCLSEVIIINNLKVKRKLQGRNVDKSPLS